MNLFSLISLDYPALELNSTKIHLAVWNGEHNPLDVYLKGNFKDWQQWQTKRNFERKYIISLIQLGGESRWLYAGCYKTAGCEYSNKHKCYIYKTQEIEELNKYSGRLIINFQRTGRQSYLLAENWSSLVNVTEMLPRKVEIEAFQGYNQSIITKSKLDIIIKNNIESWRSALECVSGVYLITDTITGKLYVGSATGVGGIWQRWCQYSFTGHGGNRDLRALLKEKGKDYSSNFQYTVLEIADTHTSHTKILEREAYWKKVLCSKEHGYNAN